MFYPNTLDYQGAGFRLEIGESVVIFDTVNRKNDAELRTSESSEDCTRFAKKILRLAALASATLFLVGCQDDSTSDAPSVGSSQTSSAQGADDAVPTEDGPWADYELEPPSEETAAILQQHPAIYPHQVCTNDDEFSGSVSADFLTTQNDGSQAICVWNDPAGCVPEGSNYADMASCDVVRTLGPSWFVQPERHFRTDPALKDDPDYRRELKWVTDQVASSGCSCCHASERSGHASAFDIDAPGSWTDTLTITGIALAAALSTEHKHLGYLPPETNFGFDRETTLFATTDIPRMRAFFEAEFERRGGTQDDVDTAEERFRQINRGLFEEATECVPGEGFDPQGRVVWNGGGARQVYIQEVGSDNPGSPPNLDKPEGTLWALYADHDAAPIESGTVVPGQIPEGTRQAVPSTTEQELVFEEGKRYRLFVTPDFLLPYSANCEFTYGGDTEEPEVAECGSEGVLCVSVKVPDTLETTPEKMIVALYRELPPIGPPDVFPVYSVDSPQLMASDSLEVRLDARDTGLFHVFAVLYMPGGGATRWTPASGIDYIASSEPVDITEGGVILQDELVLELAP